MKKIKSIIIFMLLLPFVLTIKLVDDEFVFDDAPAQSSSVSTNDDLSLKQNDGPIENLFDKNIKKSHLKNLTPKKFKNGYLMHDNIVKKNKYFNSKNHGNKKRLFNQKQIQKNVERHLKKQLQNVKLNDDSHHLRLKKNYLSNSYRDRREAGSGYGDVDGDVDGDDYEDENYDDTEENEPAEITEQPIKIDSDTNNNGFPDEHPHRHDHKSVGIDLKPEEDIDEGEIIPVISPKLEEAMNNITSSLSSTTPTKLTTIPQTTPSTMTTTSTTTTTTTTTPLPTMTTQFVSSTSQIVESTTTKMNETNTNDIVSSSSSSPSSTTTTTTTTPSTTTTTSEDTTKEDVVILETTLIPNKIDDNNIDSDTESTLTILNENDTLSTTQLTTLVNTISTTMDKQDNNVTMDEVTESIETTSTQIPIINPRIINTVTENETTSTTTSTTPPPPPTTTTPEPTTVSSTTPSTTTTVSTTTTTTADYGVKNYPPRQDRRLKKIPVTAGKLLSYIIPADTFSDLEDGNTRNLRLSLLYKGNPVKSTHWLQFNSKTQEIYGLPLESEISIWDYDLVASDSEGLNVSDSLNIYVQQHKLSRSISFEFSIYLKIDKRTEFPTNIDWQKRVVEKLSKLYNNKNTDEITVRSIDNMETDQFIFTWTNDSIPRGNDCPKNDIINLWSVLVSNDEPSEPSNELINILSPEIRVKRIVSQGYGQCETFNIQDNIKTITLKPNISEIERPNERPMPRNQVDHIDAIVGKLLVFKVPHDTFYDREDGSARNMKMTLLTSDRMTIPPNDWLQFDSKNQEFYGIPLKQDLQHARTEYQLVVTDKNGETANDGLIVQIHNAPEKNYSVEFSMNLDVPYNIFVNSALQKRTFIEKLAELFNDKDTSMIELKSINELLTNTVVTWRNNTLSTDPCPNDEIIRLMSVLSQSDKTVSPSVFKIMGSEFPVSQINRTPLGKCLGQMTNIYNTDTYISPSENQNNNNHNNNDSKKVDKNIYDDYIITFILPAIIISTMLLFAIIIALVLYKRRKSGKMSVCEHDDERQSFRSKGIPVIFQDELEEKPDPGNKSPVILKEEKPPLPPPEYQKSDDGADEPMLPKGQSEEPYQPPPPFARNSDNNRQNRPKPTPTYRKPPPYVPP